MAATIIFGDSEQIYKNHRDYTLNPDTQLYLSRTGFENGEQQDGFVERLEGLLNGEEGEVTKTVRTDLNLLIYMSRTTGAKVTIRGLDPRDNLGGIASADA